MAKKEARFDFICVEIWSGDMNPKNYESPEEWVRRSRARGKHSLMVIDAMGHACCIATGTKKELRRKLSKIRKGAMDFRCSWQDGMEYLCERAAGVISAWANGEPTANAEAPSAA